MPEVDLSKYVNEFSFKNKLGRLLWHCVYITLFRPVPRLLFCRWRSSLLRLFGAKIGIGANVYPNVEIWAPWNLVMGSYSTLGPKVICYSMDKIIIGDNVTVSQGAHLCTGTHDISHPQMRLRHRPIKIKDMAWICASAFIHPGVSIGIGSVVSACAVVTRDVEDWSVVMGNPAVHVKVRHINGGKP